LISTPSFASNPRVDRTDSSELGCCPVTRRTFKSQPPPSLPCAERSALP
jgi:hypothetical protein